MAVYSCGRNSFSSLSRLGLGFSSKSGRSEGHFTPRVEKVFSPYVPSHYREMKTSNMAFPFHAPQSVQVWSKSSRNKEPFTLEAGTVSRPYFVSHSSGVAQTSHVALPPYGPRPLEVFSESGTNKRQITLVAETVFIPSYFSSVTETSHVALPTMLHKE
jgi:hypothetical protein